ncbi:hypothetical protein C3L33_20466, partial [Rhododendron williamsianum]
MAPSLAVAASHWPPVHQTSSQPQPVGRASFGVEQVANSTDRATENAEPVTAATSSIAPAAVVCRPSPLRNSRSAVIVITSWISMTYNVGIGIQPLNGSGDCRYAGCIADLNANCPPEPEVTSAGSGVACKSACTAFNTPEYSCTGDHTTPATCPPTQYSKLFKQACPDAYSYAYDDETSTFTCSVTDYLITFCPSGTQLLQMENLENHILSSIISNYRLLLQKLRSGVKHIFREAINAPMLY